MLTALGTPTQAEVVATITIVAATVLYLALHLLATPGVVRRLFPAYAASDDLQRTATGFFRRGLGALLLGLIPAVAVAVAFPGGLAACGLSLDDAPLSLALTLGFWLVTAPLVVPQAKTPAFRLHYPEIRVPFTRRVAAWNALTWCLYLIGYELFFRGILVLGLAVHIGPWVALALSLMGYVFVHLGKFAGEAVGTLVSGTVFGLVALETHSILMPVVAHILVALTSDHLAQRRVPTA